MILQWFTSADATELGRSLAKTYLDSAQKIGIKSEKKQQKQNTAMLNNLASQINDFKKGHKLNFYKKAKVANAFKWTLLEAGYNQTDVDEITHDLILLMR